MRKPTRDVEEDFGEPPFFGGELDEEDFGLGRESRDAHDGLRRRQPARQRLELRNEQKSLREQLSDWDDYGADFDTDL